MAEQYRVEFMVPRAAAGGGVDYGPEEYAAEGLEDAVSFAAMAAGDGQAGVAIYRRGDAGDWLWVADQERRIADRLAGDRARLARQREWHRRVEAGELTFSCGMDLRPALVRCDGCGRLLGRLHMARRIVNSSLAGFRAFADPRRAGPNNGAFLKMLYHVCKAKEGEDEQ